MAEPPSEHMRRVAQKSAYQITYVGLILNFWAQTELAIEMVIRQTLNLSTEDTCIVCGPLGTGAKVNLLKSLMAERRERAEFVKAVADFQNIVSRNTLAHGFVFFHDPEQPWFIVSRDVKDKLTVKTKLVNRYLEDDVMPALDRIFETSGFTEEDVHQYAQEIANLAQRA